MGEEIYSKKKNRIRGILIGILGAVWVIFIYRFDLIIGKCVNELGHFSFLGFGLGILAIINGVRIYRRDAKR